MSLAQSTLVQRIRYELGDRPWEDTGTASSGSSTITGASTGDWVEGDIGEFITDGDTFRTVSETGGEITATRSYWGTTGAAHGASSRILKNPRYAHVEIVNAISAVIQDKLWPLAWKKVADTITPNPTVTLWYDLAADARAIIRAIQLYGPRHHPQHAPGEALLGGERGQQGEREERRGLAASWNLCSQGGRERERRQSGRVPRRTLGRPPGCRRHTEDPGRQGQGRFEGGVDGLDRKRPVRAELD